MRSETTRTAKTGRVGRRVVQGCALADPCLMGPRREHVKHINCTYSFVNCTFGRHPHLGDAQVDFRLLRELMREHTLKIGGRKYCPSHLCKFHLNDLTIDIHNHKTL